VTPHRWDSPAVQGDYSCTTRLVPTLFPNFSTSKGRSRAVCSSDGKIEKSSTMSTGKSARAIAERSARRRDAIDTHEAAERLGDDDAAVALLKLLENREPGEPDGERRAVQRVREPRLGVRAQPIANARAACLLVAEGRTARDLAIRVLGRQPHLEVVALRRARAEVGRHVLDDAVVQPEPLQHLLGVLGEHLELRERALGRHHAHELDLVELVLADDASDVLAVRTRFATEA